MVEDRLSSSLTEMGYRRIDSNAQGIYLFYRAAENELDIVSVIHAISGEEVTLEQYEHVLEQIKVNFNNTHSYGMRLLSLVFTRNPNAAKRLCADAKEDSHWIIDMNTNRLMIYENQSGDFAGLQELIEKLLSQEQELKLDSQAAYDNTGNYPKPQVTGRNVFYRNQFTAVNTTIIIINILVFLFMQFVPLFGGTEVMLEKGALSWFRIKEDQEYYRIFSSMFMHSDWDHLINNMIVLLFIGSNLERVAGKIRYVLIYFGTGILAGLTSISYNMWKEYAQLSFNETTISIGASGAIFGLVGAVLYIVIVNRGKLREISTQQMILFVILSLYGGIVNSQIDQAAHVGGFISGILLAVILYRRPKKRV